MLQQVRVIADCAVGVFNQNVVGAVQESPVRPPRRGIIPRPDDHTAPRREHRSSLRHLPVDGVPLWPRVAERAVVSLAHQKGLARGVGQRVHKTVIMHRTAAAQRIGIRQAEVPLPGLVNGREAECFGRLMWRQGCREWKMYVASEVHEPQVERHCNIRRFEILHQKVSHIPIASLGHFQHGARLRFPNAAAGDSHGRQPLGTGC